MMTQQSRQVRQPTLVLNGNGKTGRRVAGRLIARGMPVRIGSRSGQPPFDWNDQSTWAAAVEGTRAVYVSYYPDLGVPEAPEAVRAFAELAVASGVPRLVLLSGRGEEEALRAEQALRSSGADWTIVRASWFMQNFSESFFLEPILAGEIALPGGTAAEPFIDVEDIADIAAAALSADGHEGQVYEVTGPRLLTFNDAIAEIAKATGRPISYMEITTEQFSSALAGQGVPADEVSLLNYLFTEVLDGRNAHLTDGVQRALGRAPRDFTDFAQDAAATRAWDGQ